MKQPVVLRIYKGDQLFGVKQFVEGQIVIGRQADIQVSLTDETVAVIHAAIEERDGSWYVCDLGSETGTFRNGEAVLDAKLESGDVLKIGDFRLEFYIGVPKPKAAPPVAASVAPTAVEPTVPAAPMPIPASEAPADISERTMMVDAGGSAATEAPIQAQAPTPVVTPATPKPKETSTSRPIPPSSSKGAGAGGQAGVDATKIDPMRIEAPPIFAADPAAAKIRVGGAAAAVGPKILHNDGHKKKKGRFGNTYAPPSKYQSFREFVKPSKGTVVEVLVLWKERVIDAFHFSNKAVVTMGSHPDADIVLPVMISRQRKVPLLKIDSRAIVLVTQDMTGELIKGQQSSNFSELLRQNRLVKDGDSYALVLDQGEMIRLELSDSISIIVRYTSDSPKPIPAPMLDLTAAELTGIVMAILMVFVVWLYNKIITPVPEIPDGLNDEPLRVAMLEIEKRNEPKPPAPKPPPEPIPPKPIPTPPPVKSTPSPKKVEDKKPTQQKAQAPQAATSQGAASNAAPNKNPKDAPRTQTSVKQGGAVKQGNVGGAQAQSQRKDVSKSGIFSTFGGGRNNELAQSYSGTGELTGEADKATGRAGSTENRAGEGLGSALKDTGRGGTGTAAVGVSGVKTQGRGSGVSGYGTGGLGNRKGVQIVPGGTEESYSTSIDREAIRRVVQANLRAIKTCYERELNRNPELFGKIVIEWVIGEQGRVMSARVATNELGKTRVGECVRDIIHAARFPEPPTNEEVTVQYPFFFSN